MGSIRFEGREVALRRGRHGRLGAVPRRGPDLLALAEVPPPPRPLLRDRRLPELPDHGRRRAGHAVVPDVVPRRDDGRSARHGWPSTEHDLLHVTDSLHRLMPVGFYYKTFIRPRFAWEVAEKVIRRATGLGTLPPTIGGRTQGRAARAYRRARGRRGQRRPRGRARRGRRRRARAALRRVDDRRRDRARVRRSTACARWRPRSARCRASPCSSGHAAVGIYEGLEVPLVGRRRARARPSRARGRRDRRGRDPPGLPGERPARRVARPRRRADGRRARGASRRRRRGGRRDRGRPRAPGDAPGRRGADRRGRRAGRARGRGCRRVRERSSSTARCARPAAGGR